MSVKAATKQYMLQIWNVPHPPQRGSFWLSTQPRVHGGFLQSWTGNGLSEQIMRHLKAVIAEAASEEGGSATAFKASLRLRQQRRPAVWPDAGAFILLPSASAHMNLLDPPERPSMPMDPVEGPCSRLHLTDAVFVTGHSLGGALAFLAAHDIQLALNNSPIPVAVSCYTLEHPDQAITALQPPSILLYRTAGQ
ncbi:hypothetical protein MMC29_000929 [Sticta canariensis]|nr:hypothetical protein [Sticta canariensis]